MSQHSLVYVLMDVVAEAARLRKAGLIVEWERLEREAEQYQSLSTRWNGETLIGRVRTTLEPTYAENEAFLAYEREQLRIDRRTGLLNKTKDGEE